MDINKNKLYKSFENITSYNAWRTHVNTVNGTKNKGDLFEYLCYYILLTHPYYNFTEVYLYDFIPNHIMNKLKLPDRDKGIDILCVKDGKYYGVQCKYRKNRNIVIPWNSLSTFPALCFTSGLQYGIFMTNCFEVCTDLLDKDNIINVYGNFWDTIDNAYIAMLKNYIQTGEIKHKPFVERPYQKLITDEVDKYFHSNNQYDSRGILALACGLGKSLQSWFIKERLCCNYTIVVVPSLILLSQFYLEWSRQRKINALLIGSSANKEILDTAGIILTTDLNTIVNWISACEGDKYIFCTYQSSDVLKKAILRTKVLPDLCVFDEAHNTATSEDSIFSTLISEDIDIMYRLFMTATPKVYKGLRDDVYCMEDEESYGKTIYEITMRDAIDMKLLTDYRIITPVVSDEQVDEYIKMNKYVINEKKSYESTMLSSAIMLLKLMQDKKDTIKKVLTYHSYASVRIGGIGIVKQSAESFYMLLQNLIDQMKLDIEVDWLDGTFPIKKRNKILDQFKRSGKQSIVCSARILNEGINIQCVDSVMFVSPKQSVKDVIQCTGRALRLYYGKTIANVIVPMIVDGEEESNTKSDSFVSLWDIIRAIGTQDHVIIEYFKEMSTKKSNGTRFNWLIETLNEVVIENHINIDQWTNDISYDCWKRCDNFDVVWEQVNAWVNTYNRIPSMHSKDKTEHQLGIWASNRRTYKKKGNLTDDKIEKLELIKGWFWSNDDLFDELCEQLDAWVNLNGKNPSNKSKDKIEQQLGEWVSHKRTDKKKGKLDEDKIKKLDKIKGWFWEKEDPFDEICEQLDTWVNKNGKLPSMKSEDKTEKQLGNWASNKRQEKKKGSLIDDKIKKLELIKDWYWEKEDPFDEMCEQFDTWVNENGKMPSQYSKDKTEKQFGNWASSRRQDKKKGSLTDDKIKKLELIKGWFWSNDDLFDEMREQLDTWVNKNGKIPSHGSKDKTEKQLGRWASHKRKEKKHGKLIEDKIKKLELIKGWYWGSDVIKKIISFDEMCEQLDTFVNKNGKIPSKESKDKTEKQLGNWVSNKRREKKKGKLDEDKINKLELIKGWYWIKDYTVDTNAEKFGDNQNNSGDKQENDNTVSDIDEDMLEGIEQKPKPKGKIVIKNNVGKIIKTLRK
jgi:superfamily II DNA or RNA helicase